jgi:hypothetical protein
MDHGREADGLLVAGDGNPHPTVLDERRWQGDCVEVGCQLFAIGLPDVWGSVFGRCSSTVASAANASRIVRASGAPASVVPIGRSSVVVDLLG